MDSKPVNPFQLPGPLRAGSAPLLPLDQEGQQADRVEITHEKPGGKEKSDASKPALILEARQIPSSLKDIQITGIGGHRHDPAAIALIGECMPMSRSLVAGPNMPLDSLHEMVTWVQMELRDYPELSRILQKYILDTEHPMNIVAYLRSPDSADYVMGELKEMGDLRKLSDAEFRRIVQKTFDPSQPLCQPNEDDFNLVNGQKKKEVLREDLLRRDPALYSINDEIPEEQFPMLRDYTLKLMTRIMPRLRDELQSIVSDLPVEDGFPALSARAKGAEGIVDKIRRCRQGNDGKPPIPDYCLANMPDAVGGRITVKNVKQLEEVMEKLEERFGKENIYEKDSFYANDVKKNYPYRVITYTVLIDGVPCEIQVTTLRSSLAADLWHNTGYKPIHPDLSSDPHILEYVRGTQRAVTAQEHILIAIG